MKGLKHRAMSINRQKMAPPKKTKRSPSQSMKAKVTMSVMMSTRSQKNKMNR